MFQRRDETNNLRLILHFLFFVSGIATVLIGQVLPLIGQRFSLNDLQLGYLFPAQFAGSMTGTLLTGWFGRNARLPDAAWIGAILMAAGALTINAGDFSLVLAGFFINGLGIGLTLPSINLLILELNPGRSAAALSLLNFCWGIGAIAAKPFVDLTSSGTDLGLTTLLLACSLLIAAVIVFGRRKDAREKTLAADVENVIADEPPIWTTPTAWGIALFNFIHVGFEGGMGGWLTTYSARIGETGGTLFSATFTYFLFFVIGRGIAPAILRFLSEDGLLLASLATIFCGLVVVVNADGLVLLGVGSALAGLGTSAVFPTNVSRFYRIFGPTATGRATPLFVAGTLGAATLTTAIGYVSFHSGSLRSGMFMLLASIFTLTVLQIVLSRAAARKSL